MSIVMAHDGRMFIAKPQAAGERRWRLGTFAPVVGIVFLCAFLFFFRLGDRGLHSSHEARAAQNGQSILLNNNWMLPQLYDRQVELQKPPLFYWLVAWFGWLNGGHVNAWVVRLPSAF